MLRVTRLKSAEGADRHPGQLLVMSESKPFRELLPGMALAFSCLCLAKAQPHPAAKQQVIPGTIARMTPWKRAATNGVYGATSLLSLRQAILSKVRCCQQSAPYLYPSAELARAINWPGAFFQGN